MIGLKHSRRWVLGLAGAALVVTALFGLSKPAAAASDTGSIDGGIFTVNIEGTELTIDPTTTTVKLVPSPPGVTGVVQTSGQIHFGNVPAGKYTVVLDFKFSQDNCSSLSAALSFCALTGEGASTDYFTFHKEWPVTVVAGQSVDIESTNITTPKSIGNAVQVDADGNPIITCKNADILMTAIICPLIGSFLGVMDWIVKNFIQPLLVINPLNTQDTSGAPAPLYATWNNIRNLANLVFIIGFFVIIFSQATSIGISNYGIKRLLPRLIIIAIATNISYFICSFLIDMFNVFGTGAASLLVNTVLSGNPTITNGGDFIGQIFGGGPIGDMEGFLAEGLLAAPIMFGLFCFFLVAVLILIIAAVVIILRQIMIIFLVIASPLAFVAGLLPNTDRYLGQWMSMFLRLLAMYPIIMLLFAAGKVASTILQQTGGG